MRTAPFDRSSLSTPATRSSSPISRARSSPSTPAPQPASTTSATADPAAHAPRPGNRHRRPDTPTVTNALIQDRHQCPETSHLDEIPVRHSFEHIFEYRTTHRHGCPQALAPRPTIRAVRLRLYLVAGVVSGIAAYLLGASAMGSMAIGAVAPAVLAAVPHFLRGAFVGLSTHDDVTAEMSGTEFEDYVARVVRTCGVPVIMTSITGDWGVDIIVGRRPNRLAI